MKQALSIAVSAAILLGLSGCNMVVSEDPWFTAADAAPTPVLRDGLWLSATPDCRVDEVQPAEKWPKCANSFFARGEERWSMRWDETESRGRLRRTFSGWESVDPFGEGLLVANGDHLIVQFQSQEEPHAPPPDSVDEGTEESEARSYMYGAVRPVRYDDEGRVTAFETWFIQCGPLPEPKPSTRRKNHSPRDGVEEASPSVTDKPFPGLTVIEDNCTAESVEALRRAAVLSEALGKRDTTRWVREGWR